MACSAVLLIESCTLLSNKGQLLYKQGEYSIYQKNLVSYYNASPDLYVQRNGKSYQINLNAFGKRIIPQEKIEHIAIRTINKDSVIVDCSGHLYDTLREEHFHLNITSIIDSLEKQKE